MGQKEFNKYTRSKEFKEMLSSYENARQRGEMIYLDSDDLIDIAEYYHSIYEYGKASEAADYCTELHPDEASALLFKARMALIDEHDAKKAEEAFRLVKDPDNYIEAAYIEAELLIYKGKVNEAEALLKRKYAEFMSEKDSDADEAYEEEELARMPLDIAMMYADLGYEGFAKTWMEKMTAPVEDMEYEYYETWARIYHAAGRTDKVIENLNKALDYDPYNFNGWMELYDTYYNCRDTSTTAANGNSGEEHADSDERQQASLTDKAAECAEYALAIDPDSDEALLAMGCVRYDQGKYDEAIEYFTKCAQLYPDMEQPCLFLGSIYLEKRDVTMAMKHFREAFERTDYDVITVIRSGIIFYEMGYVGTAYQVFETIITPFYEAGMMSECPPQLVTYMTRCCKDLGKTEEYKRYSQFKTKTEK